VTKTSDIKIRGRLYPITGGRPRTVDVQMRRLQVESADSTRFPFAESILSGHRLQASVHDCLLRIPDGGTVHNFGIFFKRHVRFGVNEAVRHIDPRLECRGEMAIMRLAKSGRGHTYVNLRGRDAALADHAVKK
jgi:hypothetical protein